MQRAPVRHAVVLDFSTVTQHHPAWHTPAKGEMKVTAPLDLQFQPAVLANHEHRRNARQQLIIGLEREGGRVSRHETVVDATAPDATRYVERLVKF